MPNSSPALVGDAIINYWLRPSQSSTEAPDHTHYVSGPLFSLSLSVCTSLQYRDPLTHFLFVQSFTEALFLLPRLYSYSSRVVVTFRGTSVSCSPEPRSAVGRNSVPHLSFLRFCRVACAFSFCVSPSLPVLPGPDSRLYLFLLRTSIPLTPIFVPPTPRFKRP